MPRIEQKYDFKNIESFVAEHWSKNEKLIKSMTQYDSKKKIFAFLEGPPTANAPPGLHHIEMRVFKDVMGRFKYMQGFTVPRKAGWDCHGLPVEVQVEKKLGLKSKKDVLNFGVEKFNKECRNDVFTFIKSWNENTKKLAYLVDLDSPYRTLDNTYIESVWWSLKEVHKKGLLYEGHKVVPYCPRCETPLSSHEVALGYEDVAENTITVKFRQRGKQNRFFLAWTTTPWTLPSNVCLAINPKIKYAVVSENGNEYVLAEDLVQKYFEEPKIIEEFSGKNLVGIEYEPLFPYFKLKFKNAWKIVPEDYVSTEDGTGIVHQAPAFGEADYDSCKSHGMPFVQPVKLDGTFTEEAIDFKGMFVKDADPKIIEWLEDKKLLFKTEKYTHSYPFCWRCKTPLLYYAMISWFISVTKIRERLIELNKKIEWYPDNIKEGRFGKWIEGAKDWALSRTKFWGTPLPVWKCACGKIEVIGSIKELNEKSTKKLPKELDLHKPHVDDIKIKCACGKEMTRVPDVIDCWYDSGSATFAQFHYPFENKEIFSKSIPYDFIAEAIDQTRGWFYTLLILSAILFNKPAYKRCAVGGLLCDEKGDKMSKTKGNILKPDELFDKIGVDAIRMLMCSYPFGENIRFGYGPIKETIQPFITILWNSFYYALNFLEEHNFKKISAGTLSIEDKWIISKINTLIKTVQTSLDTGKYNNAVSAIQYFVNEDLSRGYIKLVRDRASEKDDALAYTFKYVFERLLKVLAPFAVYTSEYLYQNFEPKKESIHLDSWPEIEKIDAELEQNMEVIKELISSINFAREKAQLGLKWPVKSVEIATQSRRTEKSVQSLKEVLTAQTNVKIINTIPELKDAKEKIKINQAIIGRDFAEKSPKIIAKLSTENLDALLKKIKKDGTVSVSIEGQKFELSRAHFIFERTYPQNFIEAEFSEGQIYLDKTRTPELDAEGYAREVMRKVQELRKKAGMQKKDEINLVIIVDSDLEKKLAKFVEAIAEKCGAKNIAITSKEEKQHFHTSEEKIKNHKIKICLEKAV